MASQLDEQQFNQILDRVAASAPKGLSEEDFNKLLDAEVAKASPTQPAAKPKNPEPPGIIAEGLGTLKKVGNFIGGLTAPGRYYDDAGDLLPKAYDAQGKPTQPAGSREMGDYVGAHPIREGINVALPIAAETIAAPAYRGMGNILKNNGPVIRKASRGGILGVIGKYAENIGEFMSPTAEKAATAAAAKPVKGARLAPASDEEIAATIEEELNKRLGSPSPMASHASQTLDEVTSARLADQAASPARAGAATDFTKPNANAGGTLTPRTGALQADLSRNLDSLMRAPHAPVGNEAALATDAHLADAAVSPARAGATTDFMRPPVVPSPNAGGTLAPKSVPGIVQEIDSALTRLRQGEATGAPAPAELAANPAGGRVTAPPNPNSYTATRTPATAKRLGVPEFEQGPAAPVKPPTPKNRVAERPAATLPNAHAEALNDPGVQALLEERYQEHLRALPNANDIPGVTRTPSPQGPLPEQQAHMDSFTSGNPMPANGAMRAEPVDVPGVVEPAVVPGSKGKGSKNAGMTENDIKDLAARLGLSVEDTTAHLKAAEQARALRHLDNLAKNNAKPATIAGELAKYRAKFGETFGS